MMHARTLRLAFAGLLVASALAAGTLERAQSLFDSGDLDGARREAAEVVASAAGDERAAALDLLGAIAVESERWSEARDAWKRLVAEHPGTPLAQQARTKLALAEAVLGGEEESPAPPEPVGGPVAAPVAAPAAPPSDRDAEAAAPAVAAVAAGPAATSGSGEAVGRAPGAERPAAPSAPPPPIPAPPPVSDDGDDRDDPSATALAAAEVAAPAPATESAESVGRAPGTKRPTPPPLPPAAAPEPVSGDDQDDPAAVPVAPAKGAAPPAAGETRSGAEGRAPGAEPSSPMAPSAAPGPAGKAAEPAPGTPRPGTAVLIAGDGKPRQDFQDAAEQVMAFLAERGIAVREAPNGLAMLQDTRAAMSEFLEAARDAEAASLLYFEAQFGHREKIEIECFSPDGATLWREKITGGLGLSDRKVNKRLMSRFLDKLGARVSGPGLPLQ